MVQPAVQFVRSFYAWYVPLARQGTGLSTALGDSASLFTPELVAALGEDARAQAMDTVDVVGLDGDPFLDAQDFCEAYDVTTGRIERAHVLVQVHGVCSGERHAGADVVAEVAVAGTGWRFVNFRYPGRHADLLGDLARLAEMRTRI